MGVQKEQLPTSGNVKIWRISKQIREMHKTLYKLRFLLALSRWVLS